MDDARIRFLRDRVMTATPAQRVVMLFDRLALDLQRAIDSIDDSADGAEQFAAGEHVGHATTIVAELLGSLDQTAGGPADNLGALYTFLLKELTAARVDNDSARLKPLQAIVAGLRDAFAEAAATLAGTVAVSAAASASFGTGAAAASPARAWVG